MSDVIVIFSTVKINFNLKSFGSMVTARNCLLKDPVMPVERLKMTLALPINLWLHLRMQLPKMD